jgi:hypothetical protein
MIPCAAKKPPAKAAYYIVLNNDRKVSRRYVHCGRRRDLLCSTKITISFEHGGASRKIQTAYYHFIKETW